MFGAIGGFITFIIIAVIILFVLSTCIRVVPQAQALVVERLGAYLGTYSVGIHFLVPFIDRVAKKVNLKEQVEDFPPQPVITKDNVTMQIDTVVFFYITDPKLYAYGVERPLLAIENLTATTLRNIIGDLELDETLTSRETINAKMQESLDIRRNDNLISLSVGSCLECFQTLKLENCIVSPGLLDKADTVRRSLLYGTDGLCLAFRLSNLLLLLCLGGKNSCFFLTLGIQHS